MPVWDFNDLAKKGYRPGSILRVHMVNFLTYDDSEVFPGPRLNVVLGPNGTGKSTMTHAICLACGGSPLAIGRASELNKFVKNDKQDQECFVEVDILSPKNTVFTIKREINSQNKGSSWYINGSKSKEAAVKELMLTMSIDMSNLCSFMPQDRVGKFTRLGPHEVLQETLKCISSGIEGRSLYDIQVELAGYESNKLQSENIKIQKKGHIIQLENNIALLKGDVDRMESRKELVKQLEVHQVAVNLARIQSILTESTSQKAILKDLQTNLARENEKLSPLEKRERDLNRQQAEFNRSIEGTKTSFRKANDELRKYKDSAENLDLEIENISSELADIARQRAQQEAKLAAAKDEVRQREVEISSADRAQPLIKERIQETTALLTELTKKTAAFDIQKDDLNEQISQNSSFINKYTIEMNGLKDHNQIFRKKLENSRINPKVLEFMSWVDSNDTFESEVFGPIGRHLRVSDPAVQAMVEHSIPFKTLTSTFIALTESDGLKLKQRASGLASGINIITLTNHVFPPRNVSVDTNSFRHIGLGFLADQVQCPDQVMMFLQQFYSFHAVMWARTDMSRNPINDHDLEKLSLHRLYIDNSQRQPGNLNIIYYYGSQSKYGNRSISMSTEKVYAKNILSSGDDNSEKRKAELELLLREVKSKDSQLTKNLEKIRQEAHAVILEEGKCKENLQGLRKGLKLPSDLRLKLDSAKSKVDDLERKLSTNVEEEKRKKLNKYKEKIREFEETMIRAAQQCSEVLQLELKYLASNDSKSNLNDQIDAVKTEIEEARRSLDGLNRRIHDVKRSLNDLEINMKRVEADIKIFETKVGEERFNIILNDVATLDIESPNATETLEDRVAYFEAQLARSVNNPAVIERYNDLKRTLAKEQEEYDQLEKEFLSIEDDLVKRSSDWLDRVENVRRKLNELFGEYMAELKFKGEVELVKVGKFNEYEMQMKVSFREDSAVANLSGFRHSGGERNVSTMMYLMALQGMTTAPFRIVDEINQGMDERNERLVCDRIVRNCCESNRSPQYFLITPKLLEALQALNNDDITVLIVFNGPGAVLNWDLPKYIKTLKNRHRDLLTDIDTEDDSDNDSVVEVVTKKRIANEMPTSTEEIKRTRKM